MEFSPKDKTLLRGRYLLKQAEETGFDLKERRALMEGAQNFRNLLPGEVAAFFRLFRGRVPDEDRLHFL